MVSPRQRETNTPQWPAAEFAERKARCVRPEKPPRKIRAAAVFWGSALPSRRCGRARWGAWDFRGMQRSGAKPEHVAWFADDSPGEIACSNRRMTADAQNDSRGRPLRLPIIGGLNFRKTPRLGLYPIVRNTR